MKNKTSNAVSSIAAVALIFMIMSCQLFNPNKFLKSGTNIDIQTNNNLANALVGKWEVQSFTQKFRITFNKDNTYSQDEDNGASEAGTYAVVDDKTVIFQSPVDGKVTVKFVVNNGSISWTNSKGNTIYGKRVS